MATMNLLSPESQFAVFGEAAPIDQGDISPSRAHKRNGQGSQRERLKPWCTALKILFIAGACISIGFGCYVYLRIAMIDKDENLPAAVAKP
jgi:hypothetical protein